MIQYKVKKITRLTADVKSYELVQDNGEKIVYQAGQFITLLFSKSGQEFRRSYSFSSSPARDETPTITVKRKSNGIASRHLHEQIVEGQQIKGLAPAGLFTLQSLLEDTRKLVCYAAGIGITPILSILKEGLLVRPDLQLFLIYSNADVAVALFRKELELLEKEFPNRLQITWLYSNNKDLKYARLTQHSLPFILDKNGITTHKDTQHYLCGPLNYEFLLRRALRENGIPTANIRSENFNPEPPIMYQNNPETEDRQVTIMKEGVEYSFPVSPSQTILEAAQNAGFQLPYSCNTGRCSACALRCISGSIWMSYNEVLTERDLQKGLVLSCTGHPLGSNVVLTF